MLKYQYLLSLIFCFGLLSSQAQNINITLPTNPPASTTDWGVGVNQFNIMVNGISPDSRSRILVTIRSGGSKICGSYTSLSAPLTNINSVAPKTWIGNAASSLLGQDCTIPPGSYEVCVQIYGYKTQNENALLAEQCKPFFIEDKKNEMCSPPNNIGPQDEKLFTDRDLLMPIIFSWTPFISSSRPPVVTYQLTVWEVEDGQTNAEAIYNNFPVIQETITGQTRFIARPGLIEKRNAKYIWRVVAVDQKGNPLCETAQSEITSFKVEIKEKPQDPKDDCCKNIIKEKNDKLTVTSGIANISQGFNISPTNIKYITAEIISVEESNIDPKCMDCLPKENWAYNFISHNYTTWNSDAPVKASPVNSTSYYPAKLIEWHCNKQGDVKFDFKIPLPANAAGCKRTSKICIRYRFTDIDCVTCEKIICYEAK